VGKHKLKAGHVICIQRDADENDQQHVAKGSGEWMASRENAKCGFLIPIQEIHQYQESQRNIIIPEFCKDRQFGISAIRFRYENGDE